MKEVKLYVLFLLSLHLNLYFKTLFETVILPILSELIFTKLINSI